jgi:hypothetical protein
VDGIIEEWADGISWIRDTLIGVLALEEASPKMLGGSPQIDEPGGQGRRRELRREREVAVRP